MTGGAAVAGSLRGPIREAGCAPVNDAMPENELHAEVARLQNLLAEAAHELNQPLAAIISYVTGCANRLRAGTGSPAEVIRALEKAAAQAERAAEIVRRLRASGGP